MRKIAFLLAFLPLLLQAQQLNVASYNIRCENSTDNLNGNGWVVRCPRVTELIQKYDFDLFGAQEVTKRQLTDLLDRLPEYGFIGVGRDDGKERGEFSPIFYKKADFKVLKSGTFWLAPKDSSPSIGWDAALPRICSWAEFQPKTGAHFWFFNLHMDHLGKVARLESAKLVLQKIKELCGTDPVILVGDFNMDQSSAGYAELAFSGLLNDAYRIASVKQSNKPTFNDYDLNATGDSRIDHVFVTERFDVIRYELLTDTYQAEKTRLPSDHYPVKVVVIIK